MAWLIFALIWAAVGFVVAGAFVAVFYFVMGCKFPRRTSKAIPECNRARSFVAPPIKAEYIEKEKL